MEASKGNIEALAVAKYAIARIGGQPPKQYRVLGVVRYSGGALDDQPVAVAIGDTDAVMMELAGDDEWRYAPGTVIPPKSGEAGAKGMLVISRLGSIKGDSTAPAAVICVPCPWWLAGVGELPTDQRRRGAWVTLAGLSHVERVFSDPDATDRLIGMGVESDDE